MSTLNYGLVKNVYLENFKLFKKEELELEPGITILTGRNGVGKSLLIDGIRLAFGLNPIGVRLKNLNDYLMDSKKPARIELVLYNPVFQGARFLTSEVKDFKDECLNSDLIHIRFQINPKGETDHYGPEGDHQFFMKNQKNKWNPLSADEVDLLLSSLKSVGIDPADKMAFVPAEVFMPFVQSSPRERFQQFIEKVGLSGIGVHIEQIKEQIKEKSESIEEYEKEMREAEASRIPLEKKHEEWSKLQQIKKQFEEFQIEAKWIPYFDLENKLKAYPNKIKGLTKELNELKTEIEGKKTELQTNEGKLNDLKNNKNRENQKLDIIKKQQIEQESEKKQLQEQKRNLQSGVRTIRGQIEQDSKIKGELEGKYEKMMKEAVPAAEIMNYQTQFDDWKDKITKIEKKIEGLENKKGEFIKNKKEEINEEIKDIDSRLEEIKSKGRIEQDKKLNEIENKIQDLETKESEVDKKINIWRAEEADRLSDLGLQLKEQIKNKEKEKLELVYNLRMQSAGGYYPGVEKFFDAIKAKEGIIGPIGALIKIKEEFKDWNDPISRRLQNFLGSFIALEGKAYAEASKIRKQIIAKDPKQRIRIGKLFGPSFSAESDLDIIPKKFSGEKAVKDFLLNMIEPYEEFEEYFESYILPFIYESNVILFEEIDINKRTELLDQMNKSGDFRKRYPLLTRSGEYDQIRKFAADSINLPQPKILIGNKVKKLAQKEIEKNEAIKAVDQEIKALNNKVKSNLELMKSLVNPELEAERAEIEKQLNELRKKRDKLLKSGSEIVTQADQQELNRLEKLKQKLTSNKEAIHDLIKVQDYIKKIGEANKNLGSAKQEFDHLKDIIKRGDQTALLEKTNDDIKKYGIIVNAAKEDLDKKNKEIDEIDEKIRKLSKPADSKGINEIKANISNIAKQISSVNQVIGKINNEVELLQSKIAGKEKDIQNNKNNEQNDTKKFEKLKIELKNFKKPRQPRARTIIQHEIEKKQKELTSQSQLVTDDDEKQYQDTLKKIEKIKDLITRREEEYNKLKKEIIEWDRTRIKQIEEKVKIINEIFQEILHTIGATGEIIVEPSPIEDIENTELYFKVEFADKERRDLEEHSTGEKQYSLIALVLAIQSQSRSRITIIDEFTKGLDYSNRNYIVQKVPEMVNELDKIEQEKSDFKIQRQYIFTTPDVDVEDIPEKVNIYTIIREMPEISEIRAGA